MNGPEPPAVSFTCFGSYFLMTQLNFLEDKNISVKAQIYPLN